jgi:hypothetical protein
MTDRQANDGLPVLLRLPVIFEQLLQLLSGKEYTALYGAERKSQPLGYLAVLESGEVHEERYPVITRQTMHDTIYLLAVIAVLGNVVLEFTRLVYMEQIVSMVNERLVTDLFPVIVYEYIAHYGIHPSLKVRVRGILVHISQSLQRCLLQ